MRYPTGSSQLPLNNPGRLPAQPLILEGLAHPHRMHGTPTTKSQHTHALWHTVLTTVEDSRSTCREWVRMSSSMQQSRQRRGSGQQRAQQQAAEQAGGSQRAGGVGALAPLLR